MRINIVIDDRLLAEAMRVTGLRTKRGTVAFGLQTLRLGRQRGIRRLRGKLAWSGDLDAMRIDSASAAMQPATPVR